MSLRNKWERKLGRVGFERRVDRHCIYYYVGAYVAACGGFKLVYFVCRSKKVKWWVLRVCVCVLSCVLAYTYVTTTLILSNVTVGAFLFCR